MSTLEHAARRALETWSETGGLPDTTTNVTALDAAFIEMHQALELQTQAKPVGHFLENFGGDGYWHQAKNAIPGMTQPLYRDPRPAAQWVGLTDEEIAACKRANKRYLSSQEFARAIEAKLREKNGGPT